MSTKPGATSLPLASISSLPFAETLPTSVMQPPEIATSASNNSPPLPSAMVPPRITRSGVEVMASIPVLVFVGASSDVPPHSHPPGMRLRNASERFRAKWAPVRVKKTRKVETALRPDRFRRLAVGHQRQQDGEHHEGNRRAEHPMRQALVHDPAEQ